MRRTLKKKEMMMKMNLADELKYLAGLLDNKFISRDNVAKRLQVLASEELDRPYQKIHELMTPKPKPRPKKEG
jgi:hypothetical protein